MARIDLSDAPIIDHHAHALARLQPQSVAELQNYFTESPDPVMKARYVPDTIMWMHGIRDLPGYFQCDPTPDGVLAARNAIALADFPNTIRQDQNITPSFTNSASPP